MQLEIGKIYNGKVKGITQYGAFVDIEGGGTGMVHISEIANTYVSDIREHLTEEQEVKVKVIGINEAGKVSLSIKKALPAPPKKEFKGGEKRFDNKRQGGFKKERPAYEPAAPVDFTKNPPPVYSGKVSDDASFEDMLSKFKAASEEKFSDLKHVMDNKRRGSSRRK